MRSQISRSIRNSVLTASLKAMPSAYAAATVEVKRRRRYRRRLLKVSRGAATSLATMVAAEMTARTAFANEFGRHLPTAVATP
jgi:hypothetical protein